MRFAAEEEGVTLLELAIVIPVFLLLFLGLIDFGRMGSEFVQADKAMQIAVRTAALRPPVCTGVPDVNERGTVAQGAVPPTYGTTCKSGASVCINPGIITCTATLTNATAAEIWGKIRNLMPADATSANVRYTYAYDANLGFLGGPYTPMITAEIQNLNFRFVTPLGALVGLATAGTRTGPPATVPFPSMSASLPGEDLAQGNSG
jgi:Flp pilus assembly protein TadG